MTLNMAFPVLPLEETRARFRASGLTESCHGTTYAYALTRTGRERMLLVLQSVGYGAQIYLFPEALARPRGAAQPFYAALEAAGFGIGSKLGPSIGFNVRDDAMMATFWQAFEQLLLV